MITSVETVPVRPRSLLLLYLALALLTCTVFGQSVAFSFVRYDDQNYVYENPRITAGLTVAGCGAAFTQYHAQNWHPVTTLSHMLDCQLWGLNPAGHHAVNILLHVIAVLLLFHVLNAMTGRMWAAVFVAALFAIHPLRAESVAWLSERKDVLSGVFFMLAILMYLRYTRQRSLRRYFVVMVVFALGLMSKPTLVTLPLLLMLLDFWPLGRLRTDNGRSPNEAPGVLTLSQCVIEKIPLLILSLGSATMTVLAQRQTVVYDQALPLGDRLGNAVVSYVTYIGQMLWPTHLGVLYPNTADNASGLSVASSALLLAAVTLIVLTTRKTRPYLVVGWIWYLVALLPMIGIVQVGLQSHADRYTYLAQIGLYLSVAWFVAELPIVRLRLGQVASAAGGMVVVAWLGCCAFVQTSSWADTESLWSHALAVTKNNAVAHHNVASLLLQRGKLDDAIFHYQEALRINPGYDTPNQLSPAIIENSLGNAFARKGDLDAAVAHYRRALQIRPRFADAASNLAAMLYRKGDLTGAISECEKVVNLPPEDSASHQRLAALLMQAQRPREAIDQYRRALELAGNAGATSAAK
jgi:protein O-mannosyl-transferase